MTDPNSGRARTNIQYVPSVRSPRGAGTVTGRGLHRGSGTAGRRLIEGSSRQLLGFHVPECGRLVRPVVTAVTPVAQDDFLEARRQDSRDESDYMLWTGPELIR